MIRPTHVFLSICALALSAQTAFAWGTAYDPNCTGFAADSFGRGLESAFNDGRNFRPHVWNTDSCYTLGYAWGKSAQAHAGDRDGCFSDYKEGLESAHTSGSITAGTSCFDAGYSAGQSDRTVGARDGDPSIVGQACVDAYKKGVADFKAQTDESYDVEGLDNQACYHQGWWESPYIR